MIHQSRRVCFDHNVRHAVCYCLGAVRHAKPKGELFFHGVDIFLHELFSLNCTFSFFFAAYSHRESQQQGLDWIGHLRNTRLLLNVSPSNMEVGLILNTLQGYVRSVLQESKESRKSAGQNGFSILLEFLKPW